MKLAEALSLRADYQKRHAQLTQRIMRNAKVQEGDEPAEDPSTLVTESERVAADLVRIIQQINLTNSRTDMGADGTLSDAIATRDVLRLRQAVFRDLAANATTVQARSTRSEVRLSVWLTLPRCKLAPTIWLVSIASWMHEFRKSIG
jgi:hypothetical protein